MNDPKARLSAADAASVVGCTPKQIRDWRYADQLPFLEDPRPEGEWPTFSLDQVLKLRVMVELGDLGLMPSDASPLAARTPAIDQIDRIDAELWAGAFVHDQSGVTPFVGRIDQLPADGSVVALQVVNASAALARIRAGLPSDADPAPAPEPAPAAADPAPEPGPASGPAAAEVGAAK